MRRALPPLLLAAVVLVTVAGVLRAAHDDRRPVAFWPGAVSAQPFFVVPPGSEACEHDLPVESRFDTIELSTGTYGRPGPPLAVSVREAGRSIASGRIAPGYPDNAAQLATVSPAVDSGGPVDVCVRNEGDRRVVVYGDLQDRVFPGYGAVDGKKVVEADLALHFRNSDPPTTLSELPEMMSRAAVMRPDPVGAWTFWALLAGLVLGVPALLSLALRRAAAADPPPARD